MLYRTALKGYRIWKRSFKVPQCVVRASVSSNAAWAHSDVLNRAVDIFFSRFLPGGSTGFLKFVLSYPTKFDDLTMCGKLAVIMITIDCSTSPIQGLVYPGGT